MWSARSPSRGREMRRTASILALTAAALASVATTEYDFDFPATFRAEPVQLTLDPDTTTAVTATLEASWSDDARRRADSNGDRPHGDEGEQRAAAKCAGGVASVLSQQVEHGTPRKGIDRFLRQRRRGRFVGITGLS